MELYTVGATLKQIAEQCGVSEMTASRDVRKATRAAIAKRDQNAEAMVELELGRLDRITLKMTMVLADDNARLAQTRAAAVLVRCSESRRRLLGLDAASRVEVAPVVVRHETSTLSMDEIERRLETARQVIAASKALEAKTAPEPPPLTAVEAAKQLYAAELLARRTNGH